MKEFEYEPVPGLPERLPAGEYILWQGTPDAQGLARYALHTHKIAVYFALLVAWRIGSGLYDADAVGAIAFSGSILLTMAAVVIGLFMGFAWLVQRTTLYTVTNRRVVMRIGVALPMCINLPLKLVSNAAVKANADGTGDIALTFSGPTQLSYMVLWPHARPWHFGQPQPTLRAIPDVERVADLVKLALAEQSEAPAAVTTTAGERRPRQPKPQLVAAE